MNDMPSKYFFRQRMKNRIYDAVIAAVEDAAAKRGMRKRDIAEKLGVDPSQVTRWLSGPANWGANTISDLMFAVDAELEFDFVTFADRQRQKSNHFHPLEAITSDPKDHQGLATATAPRLAQIPVAVAAGGWTPATDRAFGKPFRGVNLSSPASPQGTQGAMLAAPIGLANVPFEPARQLAAAQSQRGVS